MLSATTTDNIVQSPMRNIYMGNQVSVDEDNENLYFVYGDRLSRYSLKDNTLTQIYSLQSEYYSNYNTSSKNGVVYMYKNTKESETGKRFCEIYKYDVISNTELPSVTIEIPEDLGDDTLADLVIDNNGYMYFRYGGANASLISFDKNGNYVDRLENKNQSDYARSYCVSYNDMAIYYVLPNLPGRSGYVKIDNGKFVDGGIATTGGKLYVSGKLTINDATFSTTRTEPAYEYNYMISLGPDSECIVNGGEFSHTDTIIYIGGSKYSNNCKLTINAGNFKCSYRDAIEIYTFYPYVDTDGNKEVITPKITLNDCNIEATHTAIGFWGGCTDEEFRNENTQILTILGGNYKSSKQNNGSPLEIRTYADPNTYFNPKDFVLQGGTFETLSDGLGAIRLLGPRKR